MSYYFPFGGATATSVQNINFALTAVTASVPSSNTVVTFTASYATFSGSNPPSGTAGISPTLIECQNNTPASASGSQGPQGAAGLKGSDNLTCPEGTISCPDLNSSLVAINNNLPSGSQYSIVCMQIPAGCTAGAPGVVCPPTLPTAYPQIV